jgi:hypothetical protein
MAVTSALFIWQNEDNRHSTGYDWSRRLAVGGSEIKGVKAFTL